MTNLYKMFLGFGWNKPLSSVQTFLEELAASSLGERRASLSVLTAGKLVMGSVQVHTCELQHLQLGDCIVAIMFSCNEFFL